MMMQHYPPDGLFCDIQEQDDVDDGNPGQPWILGIGFLRYGLERQRRVHIQRQHKYPRKKKHPAGGGRCCGAIILGRSAASRQQGDRPGSQPIWRPNAVLWKSHDEFPQGSRERGKLVADAIERCRACPKHFGAKSSFVEIAAALKSHR
jgi:hypothetical protein